MTDNYDDIINIPRPEPRYHTRMPMENRAAQFAPFSALSGHAEALQEEARKTETPLPNDEEEAYYDEE